MRHVKLLAIAITSFLGAILGEGLVRRAIALLLCGVLSFNSTACYGFFLDRANASIKVTTNTQVAINAEFSNSQIEINEVIAQLPRIRQQNPQSGDVPLSKPNNNSPQVVPQTLIQDSLTSPKNQSSESNSSCSDRVNSFNLYKSANGVCVYKQTLSEEQNNYVTTVDMSKAKLHTLTGPVENNNVLARGSNYFLDETEKINKQGLKFRAMVNGTMFATPDGGSDITLGNIYKYGERIIPLGIKREGKIIQQYSPKQVNSQFAHRAFCFGSTTAFIRDDVADAFKDNTTCRNFVGLYAPTFTNEKPITGQRTFVGVGDGNGKGSRVLFFSSYSATLKEARDTLTSFGATSIAQLDGGASVFLQWGNEESLIKGNRLTSVLGTGIPSMIAIYSEETEPTHRDGKISGAKSYGDPHIVTFDGYRYSFQTVGEFVLAKSTDGAFEVQTRQSPVNRSLSLNSAVAMRVGNDRVAFYSKDFPDSNTSTPLRINGKPTVVQYKSLSLPGGGSIQKQSDSNYVVEWATGEKVAVTIYSRGQFKYMDVFPFVFESQANQMVGLLGNVNGKKDDDLRFRSGDILPSKSTYGNVSKLIQGVSSVRLPLGQLEKMYFDKLNKDFGNSWRVSPEESLFDYPSSKSTKSFTDKAFPDAYLTLDMLSPEQLQAARSQCLKAGVDTGLLEGCVFDVGFTGYSEFAARTAQVSNILNIVESVIPGFKNPIPDIIRKLPKIPGLKF